MCIRDRFCGAGMTLYFNTRKNPDIQLDFKGFRPSAKAIGRIYTCLLYTSRCV